MRSAVNKFWAPGGDVLLVTDRQRAVLRLLAGGATMREIGRSLGIASTNGVRDHYMALARKGLVEATGHAAHTDYRLTDAGLLVVGLRRCAHCGGVGTVRA